MASAEDRAALVDRFYAAYREAAEKSGFDLEVRIEDERTLFPESFKDENWLDLFTLGSGWRLITTQEELVDETSGRGLFHYDFSWQKQRPEAEEAIRDLNLSQADLSIADALRELKKMNLGERYPFAIETFIVHLALGERSRSYRAAAFFYAAEGGGLEVSLEDQIAHEASGALAMQPDPVTAAEVEAARSPWSAVGSQGRITAPSTNPACTVSSIVKTAPQWSKVVDATGHTSGRHGGQTGVEVTCSYAGDCTVHCASRFQFDMCFENGSLFASMPLCLYHEYTVSKRAGTASAYNAAVSCGVALGCAIKECCIGRCGGTVSFSIGGTAGLPSISASGDGSARIFDMSVDNQLACAPPTLISNPDPCAASSVLRPGSALGRSCVDGPDGDDPSSPPGDGSNTGCHEECTPVLIDLDRGGFRLTDLAGGTRFDLDRDGTAESLSWTEAGGGDAWLALDRNGNGLIDDGGELFGNFTDQPDAGERNGYKALAVFDDPAAGGDGDQAITPVDPVFSQLLLWTDANGDGHSQPGELTHLADGGVTRISLRVVESRRRDEHGNEFRYTGLVKLIRSTTQSTDVFLLKQP
jgi:hypothetical protein